MKKSIKITKQENLLASNGTEYLIPYLDGQQYLASDTNVVYEDIGGKRMAITEVRFAKDIENDIPGNNTDWANFLTIIKSEGEYKLYYYDLDGNKIPISVEGVELGLNNNYLIIINPNDWNSEEDENYFYIDWSLPGLKTIDTIIVDGSPSYFWNFGLEAEIIKDGIKFSIPKQSEGDQNSEPGKPLDSLELNVTVIKAHEEL